MECRTTLALDPSILEIYGDLARMLADRGQLVEATSLLRKALEMKPDQPEARHNLGLLLYRQGQLAEAMGQWSELLRLHPENTETLNQVAWVLATSAEASVRDGARAVEMARHAVRLTDGQEPNLLDTLAAAQAEVGRFDEAIDTTQRALALASRQENTALAATLRARIRLYEAQTPVRAPRPPPPSSSMGQ